MNNERMVKRGCLDLTNHSANSKLKCLFGDIKQADSSFYRDFHNQLDTSSVHILINSIYRLPSKVRLFSEKRLLLLGKFGKSRHENKESW